MRLKQIGFFTAIILSLFIINGLMHSINSLWQKKTLILTAQNELAKEQERNQELKRKLVFVNKPDFVEEEARDKLLLIKPGEAVIVIPSQNPLASPTASPKPSDLRPNWQKWWELFF